jgi:hypothetical protein
MEGFARGHPELLRSIFEFLDEPKDVGSFLRVKCLYNSLTFECITKAKQRFLLRIVSDGEENIVLLPYGVFHGVCTRYGNTSGLKTSRTYKKGVLHGPSLTLQRGVLIKYAEYKDGKLMEHV